MSRLTKFSILIFILSFGIRIPLLLNSHFLFDQYQLFKIIDDFVVQGEFPLFGPLVTGGPARLPGGLVSLIFSIPHFIYHHPLTTYWWTGFLSSVGFLFYFLGLVKVNPHYMRESFFFVLWASFLPTILLHTTFPWNPNLLVFLFGFLYWLWRCQSQYGLNIFWMLLFLMPTVHLGVTPLVIFALVSLRHRINKNTFIGFLLALLFLLPYLIHDFDLELENTLGLWKGGDKDWIASSQILLLSLSEPIRFFSNDLFYYENQLFFRSWNFGEWIKSFFFPSEIRSFLSIPFILISYAIPVIVFSRIRRAGLLILAFLTMVTFWFLASSHFHPHYFLPMGLLILGVMGEWRFFYFVMNSKRLNLLLCLSSVVGLILTYNVVFQLDRRNSVGRIKENLYRIDKEIKGKKVNIQADFIYSSKAYENLSQYFLGREIKVSPQGLRFYIEN